MLTALDSSIRSRARGCRRFTATARAMTQRSRGWVRCCSARLATRCDVAPLRWRTRPDGDLDDLAMQAADDALVAILGKLDRFRGDARFTTWARPFSELEVPGKIRRRLGHARETPTDTETLELRPADGDDAQAISEAADLADRLAELIVTELTSHQREVLIAGDRRGRLQGSRDPPALDSGSLQDPPRRTTQAQTRACRPRTRRP